MWTISSEQLTKRHSQASVCRRKLPRAGIGLGALAIAMSWCVAVSANYERALEHFESGRYEDSISELQTTLAQAPDKTAARVLLGCALLATDQAAAAIAELETALSMGGDRNLIMVPLGTAFLQALKPERVLTGILPLGHDARTDGEILLLRGAAAMVYGDLGLARQVFREAEIHLPEDPRPLIGQARVALAQGKMELAHQRLELALVRDPRSSEAWTLIGTTYRDAGDFDAAERALSEALQIDPDFDKALSARAGLKLASGSGADASVDARRVLEKNPIDLEGLYIESQLLRRDGQVEAARALLQESTEQLLAIAPEHREKLPQVDLMLGVVHFAEGRYEQAESLIRRFSERYPRHVGARQYLAAAYIGLERWDAAIKALAPTPGESLTDDPTSLALLAEAHRANGAFDRAKKAYRRALTRMPAQPVLQLGLAESQFAVGETSQAIMAARALVNAEPDWFDAHAALVRMHVKTNDDEAAATVVAGLAQRHPADWRVHNLHAAVEVARGDYTAAMSHLDRAVEAAPGVLQPNLNRARLTARIGEQRSARTVYEALVKKYPKALIPRHELAALYVAEGDVDRADQMLGELLQLDADNVHAQLGMLRVHLARGDAEKLEDVISLVRRSHSRDAEILHRLARVQSASNDREQALVGLRRASEHAGFDADILHAIAFDQLAVNDVTGAQWSITKALTANPDHAGALTLAVLARIARHKLDAAEEALMTLRERYPGDPQTHMVEGDLAMARDDYPRAVAAFSRAYEIKPGRASVRRLFSAQVAAGDVDLALKTIRVWILIDPDDLTSRHHLAELLFDAGALRGAQLVYEGILKYNADDPVVANNLALVYQLQGDKRARAMAERAFGALPAVPGVMDTYGWILAESGEPERGLEILREAHTRQATNGQIRYHIALTLLMLGRREAAARELSYAIESGRDFRDRDAANALLQELAGSRD